MIFLKVRPEENQERPWEGCRRKGNCLTLRTKSWWGTSLAVQWLGLGAFTAVARVQSLVRELRSRKVCGTAKNKRTKEDKESGQRLHPP